MKLIYSISHIIIKLLIKSSIALNFSKEKIHIIVIDKSININKARSIGLHSELNRRKHQLQYHQQQRDNSNNNHQTNKFNYCHCRKVNIKTRHRRNTNTPNQLTNYQIICIK